MNINGVTITTTEDDLAWSADGSIFWQWKREAMRLGFKDWPAHVPAPLDGYEYELCGPAILARPACSRWHRLLFRLPRGVAWWLYQRTRSKGVQP